MSTTAASLWRDLLDRIEDRFAGLVDRQRALEVDGGSVTVQPYSPDAPVRTITKMKGMSVNAGDDVLVLRVWGGGVVLGAFSDGSADPVDVVAHALATDNPHGVTAAQVGSVVKRSDANATTTDAATGAVELDTGITVGANEVWVAEWVFRIGCSGTGGVKVGVWVPAGATGFATLVGDVTTTDNIVAQVQASIGGVHAAPFHNIASSFGQIHVKATIVNGGTAGEAYIRFASAVGGETSTLFANGFVRADRVS